MGLGWPTTWNLWREPLWAVCWLLAADLAVTAVAFVACARGLGHITLGDLVRLAVIGLGAATHLVATREPEERRRDAEHRTEHVDLTSVWVFTAAVTLPLVLTIALVVGIRIERYRIARKPLHSYAFSSAAIAASAIVVHVVSVRTHLVRLPVEVADGLHESLITGLDTAIAMLVAVVTYFLVQAVLVGTARGLISGSWSLPDLLGDRPTNTLVLTTLFFAVCAVVVQAVLLPLILLLVPVVVRLAHSLARERTARAEALTDRLTGLPNRRAFDTGAPAIVATDQSLHRPTTFLLCDLDHFKRMNDHFGHIAGDEILTALADILKAQTRHGDGLYRWGGEEFALLLPDTSKAEALAIAHRIRRAVAEVPVTIRKAAGGRTIRLNTPGQPRCSVSIGLAHSSATGLDLDDLFLLADEALKRAKDGGRNRVVAASSTERCGTACHA